MKYLLFGLILCTCQTTFAPRLEHPFPRAIEEEDEQDEQFLPIHVKKTIVAYLKEHAQILIDPYNASQRELLKNALSCFDLSGNPETELLYDFSVHGPSVRAFLIQEKQTELIKLIEKSMRNKVVH